MGIFKKSNSEFIPETITQMQIDGLLKDYNEIKERLKTMTLEEKIDELLSMYIEDKFQKKSCNIFGISC